MVKHIYLYFGDCNLDKVRQIKPAQHYILILEIWGRAQREAARGVRKQALINF